MELVKWSQWSPYGMMRNGRNDYETLMSWMNDLAVDAQMHVNNQDKNHTVYGREILSGDGTLKEVRFYCGLYMTDEELDEVTKSCRNDVMYIAHKEEK